MLCCLQNLALVAKVPKVSEGNVQNPMYIAWCSLYTVNKQCDADCQLAAVLQRLMMVSLNVMSLLCQKHYST